VSQDVTERPPPGFRTEAIGRCAPASAAGFYRWSNVSPHRLLSGVAIRSADSSLTPCLWLRVLASVCRSMRSPRRCASPRRSLPATPRIRCRGVPACASTSGSIRRKYGASGESAATRNVSQTRALTGTPPRALTALTQDAATPTAAPMVTTPPIVVFAFLRAGFPTVPAPHSVSATRQCLCPESCRADRRRPSRPRSTRPRPHTAAPPPAMVRVVVRDTRTRTVRRGAPPGPALRAVWLVCPPPACTARAPRPACRSSVNYGSSRGITDRHRRSRRH
jgi:hypothetical protein